MKNRVILGLVLVLVLGLSTLVSAASVTPVFYADWTSGDAGQECVVNLGYDFGLKVDNWLSSGMNGIYTGACDGQGSCELAPEYNNNITISNSDAYFFDWAATPFALSAVVVKGGKGGGANVFFYDPAASSDTSLYAPENTNSPDPDDTFEISHASFCWDLQEQDKCYQDETAWAKGTRYVNRGSWAMYVAYEGVEKTVDLIADGGDGVGMLAGTVTFSAPSDGYVEITINLDNTFIFYYDLNDDEEDENLKVQDYAGTPPSKNPKVGRFDWKESVPVGSTTGSITVPANNYYGVHLDVAYEVPCE